MIELKQIAGKLPRIVLGLGIFYFLYQCERPNTGSSSSSEKAISTTSDPEKTAKPGSSIKDINLKNFLEASASIIKVQDTIQSLLQNGASASFWLYTPIIRIDKSLGIYNVGSFLKITDNSGRLLEKSYQAVLKNKCGGANESRCYEIIYLEVGNELLIASKKDLAAIKGKTFEWDKPAKKNIVLSLIEGACEKQGADVSWAVLTPGGDTVKEANGSLLTLLVEPGDYTAIKIWTPPEVVVQLLRRRLFASI